MFKIQIFSLFGEILLKDSGVENKLDKIDKKGKSTSKSMMSSFGSIAKSALKLGAILGIGLGLKDMITKTAESQKTLAQMDAVLKSTKGSAGMSKKALLDLADAQSKVTTFSKGTTEAGENLMLTFTGIGKKVFPNAMKSAQDMATAMHTDLSSSCMTLGKALNDPATGMAKLTKQGVTFTAAQKKQVKAMVAVGNVSGAQAIMLKELQKEFGGSAEAAGKTFAGKLKILQNTISGVSVKLGTTLMPYLTKFVSFISSHMPQIQKVVTGVIQAIVPKFQQWVKLLGQIINEIMPKFGKSTTDTSSKLADLGNNGLQKVTDGLTLIKNNMPLVKAGIVALSAVWVLQKGFILAHNLALLAHNVQSTISAAKGGIETAQIWLMIAAEKAHAVATKIGTAAQWLLNAAMSANPIGIIIALIVGLVAGLVILYNKNKTFHNFVVNSFATIKRVGGEAIHGIIGFFKEWGIAILALVLPIVGIPLLIVQHWGTIGPFLAKLWANIKTGVSNFFVAIGNFFAKGWNTVRTGVTNVVRDVIKAFVNFKTSASAKIKAVVDAIGKFFSDLPAKIKKSAVDMMVRHAEGISNAKSKVTNKINEVVTAIKKYFTDLPSKIRQSAIDMLTKHAEGLSSAKSKVTSKISEIIASIKKYFTDLPSKIKQTGIDMMNDFIGGINQKVKDVKKGVGDIIKDVKTAFEKGFGIASPSKYFTWVGGHLMGGLFKGMKGAQVKKFALNMVDSIKGAFGGLSGSMGGNVSGWLKAAMAITGTSMDNFAGMMSLIQGESGGNPKSINLWDSNAKKGTPSKGIGQMIDSTFRAHMLPGFTDIWNPVDNLISSIRYNISQYGSIANSPGIKSVRNGSGYRGYKVGSRYVPADVVTTVHKGEMITPADENMYKNSKGAILPPTNGGIILHIDTFVNDRKESINELLEEIAFVVKQKKLGGSNA